MSDTKKLFSNTRIIILLVLLLLSLIVIYPRFDTNGVAIRTVVKDSAASFATPTPVENPKASATPISREVLKAINNKPINSVDDYYNFVDALKPNRTISLKTNKGIYRLVTKAVVKTVVLDELVPVNVTKEVFDNQTNTTINVTEVEFRNKTKNVISGTEDIGLKVYPVPSSNIREGLDLEGGTRVILQPEQQVSPDDLDLILENLRQRLNVFGVSDVVVRSVKDFTGDTYILVEIAGISQEEIADLLSKQGKFEAKVGNITVFSGGNDVTYVCRSATCSGIDPKRGCNRVQGSKSQDDAWSCAFRFSISLSPEAAKQQAAATKDLKIVYRDGSVNSPGYLDKNLSLYLDNDLVDELLIGADLRGNAVTDISISGVGSGATQSAAALDTLNNMKKLQTVLITGSLPVKLDIIQSDAISPVLGEKFIKNALLVGLMALLVVAAVVAIRYRKAVIAIPTIVTMMSEVIILLGFAAAIGWRLDLAAIAGIIIAVGTGVDDQIVIVDETLSQKKMARVLSWKDKLKRAFFIIMTSYATTVVAMLPLWWSGAGLLKGFALTTVVGVSIGVFVTRPAFAKILEILLAREGKKEHKTD